MVHLDFEKLLASVGALTLGELVTLDATVRSLLAVPQPRQNQAETPDAPADA